MSAKPTGDKMVDAFLDLWHACGYHVTLFSDFVSNKSKMSRPWVVDLRNMAATYESLQDNLGMRKIADGRPVDLTAGQIIVLNSNLRQLHGAATWSGDRSNPFQNFAKSLVSDLYDFLPQVRLDDLRQMPFFIGGGGGPKIKSTFMNMQQFPLFYEQFQGWLGEEHPALVGLPQEWVWEILERPR